MLIYHDLLVSLTFALVLFLAFFLSKPVIFRSSGLAHRGPLGGERHALPAHARGLAAGHGQQARHCAAAPRADVRQGKRNGVVSSVSI